MSDSLRPHGLYSSWISSGQNTGVGSFSLFQGIFPTQELNSALLHCRQILYQLSHKGRLRILQWVACPFSRSSRPRNQTGSPALQADSLPTELSRKPTITIAKINHHIFCLFDYSHSNKYEMMCHCGWF